MLKPKIIVVLGPTATGKSALAVRLARKFEGEVISADSRQVYRGLNIGTGKVTSAEMRGIPHHLLDITSPKGQFSTARYKELAERAVRAILFRGKLPIICGGTGFYIETLVDDTALPSVPPDKKLRMKLGRKTAPELYLLLKKLDPRRAKEIDRHNPVRLIRAIEIAKVLGTVPRFRKYRNKYSVLFIGLSLPAGTLKQKIRKRLIARLKSGMIAEAKRLHRQGLSWKRMEELGLEYRYLALYLQGKLDKQKMVEELTSAIWHYAKRQMTWFKRDKRIQWFTPQEVSLMEKEVIGFLKK